MESLQENKPLLWSIILSGLAIVGLLTGSSPEFNEQFGLVEIPTEVSAWCFAVLPLQPVLTPLRLSQPAESSFK